MAAYDDLDGAFKTLFDTLQNRLSPFFSRSVSQAWLGAIQHGGAIARNVNGWRRVPDPFPDNANIIGALEAAARSLAAAVTGTDDDILAALREGESALAALDQFLVR